MSRAKDNSRQRAVERLFFAYPANISADEIILCDTEAYHACKVIRLKKGDQTQVFDGNGYVYRVQVSDMVSTKRIHTQILDREHIAPAHTFSLCLVQALAQRHKFDFIIEKATELGVDSIIPFYTERTAYTIRPKEKEKVHTRWQTIAIQAAKQSRRYALPRIHEPMSFDSFIEIIKEYECAIMLSPGASEPIADLVGAIKDKRFKSVLVMIGPEGGFTDEETTRASCAGARPVSLAPNILKTDTAAIAVISILRNCL